MSDYGYDNVKRYLNLETDELRKKDNFDRYSFDGVVEWWKNKASKRYESLKSDGRLRTQKHGTVQMTLISYDEENLKKVSEIIVSNLTPDFDT